MKRRTYCCVALVIVIGVLAACSFTRGDSSQTPAFSGATTPSLDWLADCRSATSSVGSSTVIDQDRADPLFIKGDRAKVRIATGATMTGKLALCGSDVALVVQGSFIGRDANSALVYGANAKIILVDNARAEGFQVDGDKATVIRCGLKTDMMPRCNPEYFE